MRVVFESMMRFMLLMVSRVVGPHNATITCPPHAQFDDFDVGAPDAGELDDDTSWKIRFGAVRVIVAIAKSDVSNDALKLSVLDRLVTRFKEREEKVRLAVLAGFVDVVGLVNSGDVDARMETIVCVSITQALDDAADVGACPHPPTAPDPHLKLT